MNIRNRDLLLFLTKPIVDMSGNSRSNNFKQILKNNAILAALNKHELSWGNIISNNGALNKAVKNASKKNSKANNNKTRRASKNSKGSKGSKGSRGSKNSNKYLYEQNEEMLEGWNIPDLRLRKGIWENFPVDVIPIEGADGIERHAIVWNKKKVDEWRKERVYSEGESLEYERYAEYRLLHALRAHPHKYTIEAPQRKNQIVIIAMVPGAAAPVRAGAGAAAPAPPAPPAPAPVRAGAGAAAPAPAAPAAPAASAPAPFMNVPAPAASSAAAAAAPAPPAPPAFAGPKLVKLNDIKEYFPVVWRKVDGRPGKSTYALELFGKKITEMSRAVGHDVRNEVTDNLLAALRASNSWNVLRPVGREVCLLEMK